MVAGYEFTAEACEVLIDGLVIEGYSDVRPSDAYEKQIASELLVCRL
jgi:hypothetical protein